MAEAAPPRPNPHPQGEGVTRLPPPRTEVGVIGWLRANLFSSRFDSALTVVSLAAIVAALWFGLRWIFITADWTIISALGGLLAIGPYNTEQACPGQNCFWRPQVVLLMVTALLGMAWGLAGGGTARRIAIGAAVIVTLFAFLPYGFERMGMDVRLLLAANILTTLAGWAIARYTGMSARTIAFCAVAAFIITLVLFRGVSGVPGLQPVSTLHWGGLMLNLLLAVVGIVISFPIGIALALGRRSNLSVPLGDLLVHVLERSTGMRLHPRLAWVLRLLNISMVKLFCVVFIEVFRGVPLITLLFMSQVLVPLAFPEDFQPNSLLRASIIITLFSSVYMAENIRGGLQALHPGQAEAARALGLPAWQTTLFISLPQAIRNVIPAIVGQFIALFKDTTLVYIIGMLDVLEFGRAFIQGNAEYLANQKELFIFLAVVFWVFCYTMSYVSQRVEEHMGVGRR
ncbi:MAG: amino acid ABC transporter permease [Chloroflexi bacterium]|nr:amino acid ABC transporter permease [Chloroflexota bacterium]